MSPLPGRLGLGVGIDMRFGDPYGFVKNEAGRDVLSPSVASFLHRQRFTHAFFSFQPRDRGRLDLEDYVPAWDALYEALPPLEATGLHHTLLNLGSLDVEDRGELCDFTNRLTERYGLAWINEDLGIWALDGKLMPYPLPPLLTEAGLEKAIGEVEDAMRRLDTPLVVEFPGFSEGTNFFAGGMHAYDFFRVLAAETGCAITLDTGHLISYQWLLGRRGDDLFGELDRLPLASCFEIHLSGCLIKGDRFVDVHHGVLRDEQLVMAERLLARCPNARAITYEDPKPDETGRLRDKARPNFEALVNLVDERWKEHATRDRSRAPDRAPHGSGPARRARAG